MLSALVIAIYLSFLLDLLVWPIASEASTAAIWHDRKHYPRSTRILSHLMSLSNGLYIAAILIIAVVGLTPWTAQIRGLEFIGISVAIIGRIISLVGTFNLRGYEPGQLARDGIFKISRNPISLGIHLTLLGLSTAYNSWFLWLGLAIFLYSMHRKILMEEQHLARSIGKEYSEYKRRTPRYVLL